MEDLYEKLRKYCDSDYYPFHMPGHKRRLGMGMGDPLGFDITEIEGFDNLHHPEGILLEAQRRAARLYGAEETHFLGKRQHGGDSVRHRRLRALRTDSDGPKQPPGGLPCLVLKPAGSGVAVPGEIRAGRGGGGLGGA